VVLEYGFPNARRRGAKNRSLRCFRRGLKYAAAVFGCSNPRRAQQSRLAAARTGPDHCDEKRASPQASKSLTRRAQNDRTLGRTEKRLADVGSIIDVDSVFFGIGARLCTLSSGDSNFPVV